MNHKLHGVRRIIGKLLLFFNRPTSANYFLMSRIYTNKNQLLGNANSIAGTWSDRIEIPTANLAFSTMTSSVKVSIGLCDCDNNGEPETGGLAPLCYVNILACPKSLRSVLSSSPWLKPGVAVGISILSVAFPVFQRFKSYFGFGGHFRLSVVVEIVWTHFLQALSDPKSHLYALEFRSWSL